jgi:hypothetical protein
MFFHILHGCLNMLRGTEGPTFDSIVELHLSHVSSKMCLGRSDRFLFQGEVSSKVTAQDLFGIFTHNKRIVCVQKDASTVVQAVAALSGSLPHIRISRARDKFKVSRA